MLVEKAGYRNATESVLDRIDVSLKSVRVGTFPELTDPTVSREHWIKFYDLDHPIEGLQPHRVLFNVESELEAFIVANFKAMNFFRARRYGLIGRQARISPTCTIDLLAEHRRTRELVGIELKAEEPDDRLLAQVNRYLPALAARAERDQRPSARLLVISGQPDHAIVRACADSAERAGVALEWHLYRVNVGIKTVDGLGHSHRGPRKGGLGHDSR